MTALRFVAGVTTAACGRTSGALMPFCALLSAFRLVAAALLLTACSLHSQPSVETGPVVAAMGETVANRCRATWPQRFSRLDHIVFSMGGRVRSFIGYTRIDRSNGDFSVAAVTPLGVKLFVLSGDRETVRLRYLSPALVQEKQVAEAIATDIRRIYFDGLPSPEDAVFLEEGTYRFVRREEKGTTLIRIDPQRAILLEKGKRDGPQRYTVRYDGYSRAHAGKILFKNLTHRYSLSIHLKKIMTGGNG